MTYHNKKISVVVQTCDSYSHFWDGWYKMFNRFWDFDLGWQIYFCNEDADLPFNDDRIKQIKTGTSKKYLGTEEREWLPTFGGPKQVDEGWSDRLIHILESVDTDYVLYFQEDQWPKYKIDKKLFEDLLSFSYSYDVGALKLHRINRFDNNERIKTDIFIKNKRLIQWKPETEWLVSHQPTIWKRELLLDISIKGEGFRDNEYAGTERLREKYKNNFPKIYSYNHDWFYERSASTAGNWVEAVAWEFDEVANEMVKESKYELNREIYKPKSEGLKLSLVTSCFNAEHFIDELAESVISQSYDNWEWIVADDFSDDNTFQKLLDLQNKDPRITVAYPKRKKEVWWNPQKFANGDIVCHLDADDKLLPNVFEMINHYFKLFPEVVLMHFNANKYHGELPENSSQVFEKYKDNVYISNDNNSFLEGFEKLWPNRSGIFGYLRIFRNLPGLDFPVHEDGDACSSNDGQWLLMLEERGKWISIPRTVYLAREHGASENFTRWNQRGEAQLAIDAKERRKHFHLDYPRNLKYFDDIYDLAESTYTTSLNWSHEPQKISFINYAYSDEKKNKVKNLFFDHNVQYDYYESDVDYFFIKIQLETTPGDIQSILSKIKESKSLNYELILYTDNKNLHYNLRTETDNIQIIHHLVVSNGYNFNFFEQNNRYNIVSLRQSRTHEIVESPKTEIIEHEPPVMKDDSLKIMQIHVGCGIDIPPNGYGGLEEVVYQYMRCAKMKGHEVELKYLDNITQADLDYYDVFHLHTGGFSDLIRDRCIPYIFTTHDVHPWVNGKDSWFYQVNNESIKNSLFSLIPCNNLIPYYDNSEKLRKLDHGVDTNFFFPMNKNKDMRLVCLGGGDDRKGFHLAIIAARKLGLPITIIGPDSIHDNYNSVFYDVLNQAKDHIDIRQTGALNKHQLRDELNENSIIIHPSTIETGQPCLAVLEAMACGLPCVGTMQDHVEIPGLIECTREIESITDGVKTILQDYDEYSRKARSFALQRDWTNIYEKLDEYFYEARDMKDMVPRTMKERLIYSYSNSKQLFKDSELVKNVFNLKFDPNPIMEITGNDSKDYNVMFYDADTNGLVYQSTISNNCWCATTIQYFIRWKIIVKEVESDKIAFQYEMNVQEEPIRIYFDSGALGDNLAWIASVDQFQRKHKANVSCFTFYNHLFREKYPNIEFVDNHHENKNYKHSYWIGWLNSEGGRSPVDTQKVPLQKVSSSILGLDYKEERAKIVVNELEAELQNPYVCIGTQSTAQAKYWNHEGGWNEIVKYLKSKNFDVVCIDKHQRFGSGKFMNDVPEGVIHRHERTLDQTIATMNGCEFFIGLGSGLSWLAWALEKPVVLISGFSEPYSEFQIDCERVHNSDVCNSCYNRHTFDPGKWDWCPDNNDFICTKSITSEMVKNAIDNVLKRKSNNQFGKLIKPRTT